MIRRVFMLLLLLGAPGFKALAEDPQPDSPATNAITAGPAVTIAETNSISDTTNAPAAATNAPPATAAATTNRPLPVGNALLLRTGFRLQLAAAAPDVLNPVALAFDAAGRLFVAEQGREGGDGRIKVLEDADGDGAFEKAAVFADSVPSPTALICYGGGLFVASDQDILFLADTTGDGSADVRRGVFTGFTANGRVSRPAITHFAWGPDNRIHAACDGVGGDIVCLAIPTAQPLALKHSDFAFNPRTLAMSAQAGGNTRSIAFDATGRRFTSTSDHALQFTLVEPRVAAQNPFYLWPELASNLPTQDWKLFPLRPARTSALAGTSLFASRFTTSRFALPASFLIYRGGALSKGLADTLFIADPELHIVSRQQLGGKGILPELSRIPAEQNSEFLESRDPTFRPVQIVPAPDGTLCLADLARADLDEPGENGRIWRILPGSMKPSKTPNLNTLSSAALIELLGTANAWVSDTASRLLFERGDQETLLALTKKLQWSWNPSAKLQLLHLLAANDALNEEILLRALQDNDASVRENAVKLTAGVIKDGSLPQPLLQPLFVLAKDASPRIRFQLALTLAGVIHPSVPDVLTTALMRSPDDALIQSAVLTAARTNAAEVLTRLVSNPRVDRTEAGWSFLKELAWLTGTQTHSALEEALAELERSGLDTPDQLTLARHIGEGLFATGRTFMSDNGTSRSKSFASRALNIALDSDSSRLRAEAIRFLGVSGCSMEEVGDWLLALLVPAETEEVQLAVVDALAHFPDPQITTAFIQRWPRQLAPIQRAIIARLLEQIDRTHALLTAIEQGQIPPDALTAVQMNFLRTHRDGDTAARARDLLGPLVQGNVAARFAVAVDLKGSPQDGQRIYQQRCAACHRRQGEGRAFGPDLDPAADRSREQLLRDILEPNRAVKSEFQTQVIQRTSDQVIFGLVDESSKDVLLVRLADGQRLIIPRSQVEDASRQPWSLMPATVAVGLTVTDLADLLAFLTSGR